MEQFFSKENIPTPLCKRNADVEIAPTSLAPTTQIYVDWPPLVTNCCLLVAAQEATACQDKHFTSQYWRMATF